MAQKRFELTDANGSKTTKDLTEGMVLGDLLSAGQQGLIEGSISEASTTLRSGDHVEIIVKSGKAGA